MGDPSASVGPRPGGLGAAAGTPIGPAGAGRLVLASSSPRRRELVRRLRLDPVVVPADVDETPHPDESPVALVRRLAITKALAVASTRPAADVVLAGDTVVAQDGRILGKPVDVDEAAAMLRGLSGRDHRAASGVAVARGGTTEAENVRADVATTVVTLRDLRPGELAWYLASGEWRGKAGGYALQGAAGAFVASLHGLDTTVIGLPLAPTLALLRAVGLDPLAV